MDPDKRNLFIKEALLKTTEEVNRVFDIVGSAQGYYTIAFEAYKKLLTSLQEYEEYYELHMIREILDRMIEGLPLSPITDNENEWELIPHKSNCTRLNEDMEIDSVTACKCYRNKRYPTLIEKRVYEDGKTIYHDYRRACAKVNLYPPKWRGKEELGTITQFPTIDLLIDVIRPIELPYLPTLKKYTFEVNAFLHNRDTILANGRSSVYDTFHTHILITNETPESREEFPLQCYKRDPGSIIWEPISGFECMKRYNSILYRR